jgi:hypothetical protein
MNNDSVLRGNNVLKYRAEDSVVGVAVGDRIQLRSAQFAALAQAFLAEIEKRFGGSGDA